VQLERGIQWEGKRGKVTPLWHHSPSSVGGGERGCGGQRNVRGCGGWKAIDWMVREEEEDHVFVE